MFNSQMKGEEIKKQYWMLQWAVTHLRIASCLCMSAVSHHLEKNEISDQMNFLRGSSASFTTMLFKICCVWSVKYLSKVLIQPNKTRRRYSRAICTTVGKQAVQIGPQRIPVFPLLILSSQLIQRQKDRAGKRLKSAEKVQRRIKNKTHNLFK